MGIRHMDEGFGPLTAANGMVEMKDGKLRAIYLKDEIGGFAVHLLQK